MNTLKRIIILVTTIFICVFCLFVGNEQAKEREIEVVDYDDLINKKETEEVYVVVCDKKATSVTEEEYELLLRVCMSECGGKYGEPLEGKIAVVETILNRCDMYGKSIEDIVYAPNQYSVADNGEPDDTVRQAVDIALSRRTYPSNMLYFRTGHYHSFGEPYIKIGSHYFSLEV